MKMTESNNPTRSFKRVKQINNLVIYQDDTMVFSEFKVATLDKRILEEFCFMNDAEVFCKNTLDFKTKKIPINIF